MITAGLNQLAVEVIYEGHDHNGPFWLVGSGAFVCPRLVLTASHCVPGPGKVHVRLFREEEWHEYPAEVCLQGGEDEVDLAVLAVSDVAVDVPTLRYGEADRHIWGIVKDCSAIGFPWFKRQDDKPGSPRFSAQVDGEIPTSENLGQPFLTLRVNNSPRPQFDRSEWAGISGAVVFAGGNILVGVITEHHLPEGENALTVVPITAIDLLPEAEATKLWKLLGVDHQSLMHLPSFGLSMNAEQQNRYRDWVKAPDVPVLFGRTKELRILEQWIVQDRCRLVAIVGMRGVGKTQLSVKLGKGGIGKTDLSLKLAQGIEERFDYVIWRSLRDAPRVSKILTDLIKFLSNQQEVILPDTLDEQITRLLHYLQKSRCLIILDNVEGILQGGTDTVQYSPGYEEYGRIFEEIADVTHQSCLLLTSREKPIEVAGRDTQTGLVRSLELGGLSVANGKKIFARIGSFSGSKEDWKQLNSFYNGNPLALDLTARHIRQAFSGRISEFLKEGNPIFKNLKELLDWHFERLSDSHKEVMYWFAINREPTSRPNLEEDILSLEGKEQTSSTLQSLQERLPLETSDDGFTLQPVLIEYVTQQFIKQVVEEVVNGKITLLNTHTLLKTSVSDYVRDVQRRIILQPMSERLLEIYGNPARLEGRLKEILSLLQEHFRKTSGYAAGNVLNLLCYLKVDLRGYNFSGLPVWHAYLQGMNLQEVNFSHADLAKSVFTDTFGNTLCVALSKHGDLLAVGTATGEIRLWHAVSGLPVQTFRSHTDWVRSVAFSPNGKTLVSGSDDRTVCLWEVSSGELLNVLRGHTDIVSTVAFSPDGKLLASGSGDRTVCLWEVSSEQLLNTLQGHIDWVWSVAFSPDGKTLASGSGDRTTRLWEVSSGKLLNILQGHTNVVYTVAFSPNGKLLASGSGDRTVCLWEVSSGKLLNTLQGHMGWVRSVAFDPDGKTLASSGSDRTVRLWEVSSGQCLNTLQGHTDWIRSVAFGSDGKILASGSDDHMVRLWEVGSKKLLRTLQGHIDVVSAVAFSPDGKTLASSSDDHMACLWEVSSGKLLNTLQGHSFNVYAVAFSPDGRILASGSGDRTVRLWEVSSGKLLNNLQDHSHWVYAVAFSPNGKTLASGSSDHTVRLWEVSSGKLLNTLQGHTDWVKSVAFSPNGKIIASGGRDGKVCLWEVRSGKLLKTLQDHSYSVNTVAFSLDGKTLVSGSSDRTVRLWKVSSGQCLALQNHSHRVWSVAFPPDGRTFASGDDDGTINFWDFQTGAHLDTLRNDRPYERMNITQVKGLTEAQKATLRSLGAIENEVSSNNKVRN